MAGRETRKLLHRAVDRILEAMPAAVDDASARGFPRGGSGGSRSSNMRSSTTEQAAMSYDAAGSWVADAEAITRRLVELANEGMRRWPPKPKRGTRHGDVVVGERANTVETCEGCGLAVKGGADDPIRRHNGHPYHKSPCWYTATRADAAS